MSDAVETVKIDLVHPVWMHLFDYLADIPLLMGISAVADIRTGRRRGITYLASPIEQAPGTASRKR